MRLSCTKWAYRKSSRKLFTPWVPDSAFQLINKRNQQENYPEERRIVGYNPIILPYPKLVLLPNHVRTKKIENGCWSRSEELIFSPSACSTPTSLANLTCVFKFSCRIMTCGNNGADMHCARKINCNSRFRRVGSHDKRTKRWCSTPPPATVTADKLTTSTPSVLVVCEWYSRTPPLRQFAT